MKPLRAIGFRQWGAVSINDLVWAKREAAQFMLKLHNRCRPQSFRDKTCSVIWRCKA